MHIYCEKFKEKGIKISIIKTLKNTRKIDLDKSDIKASPINVFYESYGFKC